MILATRSRTLLGLAVVTGTLAACGAKDQGTTQAPPRPGPTEVAIPAYEADGATFRVLFGFGAEGLGRIQLTALKPSLATCEDLEKRLTQEHAKPSSRNAIETSLRGEEILWNTPRETI